MSMRTPRLETKMYIDDGHPEIWRLEVSTKLTGIMVDIAYQEYNDVRGDYVDRSVVSVPPDMVDLLCQALRHCAKECD